MYAFEKNTSSKNCVQPLRMENKTFYINTEYSPTKTKVGQKWYQSLALSSLLGR
jgi:hypothetical protein